jgi:hypothetical protein
MIMAGSVSPWPLYAVLLIVGLLLINQAFASGLGASVLGVRLLPSAIFLVGLTLLWYFAVAPLWGIVRQRAARRAVPAADLIRIVRLDRSALEWLAEVRRQTRAPSAVTNGTVLLATSADLEFWVGPNSELVPAAVLAWSDIVSVTEAVRRSRIEVHLSDGRTILGCRVQIGKLLRPTIATGRARRVFVTELERIRVASEDR